MHSRALELVGALWTLGLFQPAVPRSTQATDGLTFPAPNGGVLTAFMTFQ